MAGTKPKIRFSKVIEILLWLAGLGVLAENIFLLQQNRRLNETLAPQISAGTQLQMLAGLAFEWPPGAGGPSCGRFQAPHHNFFARLPGLPGKSGRLDEASERTRTKRSPRALGKP
jgi:hypothetical protein